MHKPPSRTVFFSLTTLLSGNDTRVHQRHHPTARSGLVQLTLRSRSIITACIDDRLNALHGALVSTATSPPGRKSWVAPAQSLVPPPDVGRTKGKPKEMTMTASMDATTTSAATATASAAAAASQSTKAERRAEKKEQRKKSSRIRYPFWFGGSASSMAACVTHPLDLGKIVHLHMRMVYRLTLMVSAVKVRIDV
jgi:hypothetical protein